ncbi:MAG TPA: hypothetical protein VGL81_34425 [Polyangiaceae bacterium]
MGKRMITVAAALAVMACGGGGKGADSPGTCPAGTMLKGSDCVPSGDDDSSGGGGSASDSSGGSAKGGGDGDKAAGSGGGDSAPSAGATPYDKEAVDVELKRAGRQVKANCGAATDEDGKASGPWGSTKVSVVLGRNGHVKQVTIPSPYDGKPVGLCVVHAFQKIQFPPYAGSTDVILDWDIEIPQPK